MAARPSVIIPPCEIPQTPAPPAGAVASPATASNLSPPLLTPQSAGSDDKTLPAQLRSLTFDHTPSASASAFPSPMSVSILPAGPDAVDGRSADVRPVSAALEAVHAADSRATSRRPSIQFMPPPSAVSSDRRSRISLGSSHRRNVSPPPPPLFEPRVSFTTFEKETPRTSVSLVNTHRDFVHSKTSRRFLCGIDSNDYSEYALQWLFDEMVDDNDEVVCLRVLDKESSSPTPSRQKQHQEDAATLMTKILNKNVDGKAIQLTLEYAIGRVQEVFGQMIQLHEPMILVVGTKGRSRGGIQSLLPGSISKFALQHSPVPVIVVNPSLVREKRKKKRMLDRSRRGYRDLLDKGGDHPLMIAPLGADNYSRSGSMSHLSAASQMGPASLFASTPQLSSLPTPPNTGPRRTGSIVPNSSLHSRNTSVLSCRTNMSAVSAPAGSGSGSPTVTTASSGNADTASSADSSARSSPVESRVQPFPAPPSALATSKETGR